jgi:competence protein ComEA
MRLPIAVLLCVGFAWADLPPGPGKEQLVRICGDCHSPEQAASLRQNQAAWEDTLTKMVNMGAQGSDEDYGLILAYLTKNFGPEAPKAVNVNKATELELESLSLSRAEAEAVVRYRTDKGGFKTLDDLKNVPGLDYKKIEAKKDRIVF